MKSINKISLLATFLIIMHAFSMSAQPIEKFRKQFPEPERKLNDYLTRLKVDSPKQFAKLMAEFSYLKDRAMQDLSKAKDHLNFIYNTDFDSSDDSSEMTRFENGIELYFSSYDKGNGIETLEVLSNFQDKNLRTVCHYGKCHITRIP